MSEKAKLHEMGSAEQVSASDCDKLHASGLTTDVAERAKMQGIGLSVILQFINQYGPQFVTILSDLLKYIKPLSPPVAESQPK